MRSFILVRRATLADEDALARLLLQAACVYPGGSSLTARALLDHPLQFTAWEGGELRGYLGMSILHPPTAKIEALAIRRGLDLDHCLRELLIAVEVQLRKRETRALIYYIGQDPWLLAALKNQGFRGASSILLFRKWGWEMPALTNGGVCVRRVTPQDIPVLVSLDEVAFVEQVWRNSAEAFEQCLDRMPHFVVAEQEGEVAGYQFSYIRRGAGYLARVAVHPQVQGQQIGARLVAEAIHFFRARGVRNIALNTQRDNCRAQRLYRWFGFQPAGQEAIVLRKRVDTGGPE